MREGQVRLNEVIKNIYGSNLYGEQLFRIVHTDDQTEIRKATFNNFSGKTYLSTKTETKEVKKYPYNHCWVLERWFPPMLLQGSAKELPFSNKGSYEPLFMFEDGNGSPIELNEEFVQFCIKCSLEPIALAERQALDDEMYNIDKLDAKFELDIIDAMKQQGSSFEGKLSTAAGEGIVVPDMSEISEVKNQGESTCQKIEAL